MSAVDRKFISELDPLPGGVQAGDSLLVNRVELGVDAHYRLDAQGVGSSGLTPDFTGVRLYRHPAENLGAVVLLGGHWRLVEGLLVYSAVLTLPTISGTLEAPSGAPQRPFFIGPLPTNIMPATAQHPVILSGTLTNTITGVSTTSPDLVQVTGEYLDLDGQGLKHMTTLRLKVAELTGPNLSLRTAGVYHVGV